MCRLDLDYNILYGEYEFIIIIMYLFVVIHPKFILRKQTVIVRLV